MTDNLLPDVASVIPQQYSTLSPSERRVLRERYITAQAGKCLFCNEALTSTPRKDILDKPINWRLFPPNFTKYPVHLQHNHSTDMTEGAVHAVCNAVLWQYHGR